MNSRSLRALEFNKILDFLSSYCQSEAGRKACLNLLPCSSLQDIFYLQNIYSEFLNFSGETSYKAQSFTDLSPLFNFLDESSNVLELDALFALKETMNQAKQVFISISDANKYKLLENLLEALPEMTISSLNRCINANGHIKDESSPELMLIRSEMRQMHQTFLRQVKDFAAKYNISNYLQDDYMSLFGDRYVLPLKSNFKGRLQGIIHDYSQTGETCYFEPMFLVEQNNRLQELKREEREEEHKVLLLLTNIVHDELSDILAAYNLLVQLDVLYAKSTLAEIYDGSCVNISEEANLSLIDAYHPLLALDKKIKAQPLDLIMRKDDRALVISGGNAGGKTVCLKTLGLIALMSFAGLPVPVKAGSNLTFWNKIHAFIGDEQSLDDHVSTFTAQIQNLNLAWEDADKHSLILLDEFGAGTDPAQGAALAQAVLDELIERKATVIAATHFPSLKSYALTKEHARAASVLFDERTKQPLFCLAYDQVGSSQALDVAKEHGLPESVLSRARQYLLQDSQDTDVIIKRLNDLSVKREDELRELKKEQEKFKEKREKLDKKLNEEKDKLDNELRKLSREIMQDMQNQRITHKQAMKDLAKLRTEIKKQEVIKTNNLLDINTLSVKQDVLYTAWNKNAKILDIDKKQNRIKLDLSGVSIWANLDQISTGGSSSSSKGFTMRKNAEPAKSYVALNLDLRGMTADIAEQELNRFLDKAILSGREELEIVHGRGTGALRKHVHSILKSFPAVAEFSLANEDRGGDGMTIVKLR